MNPRKLLEETIDIIRYNFVSLAGLEITYRLLTIFIILPLSSVGFKAIMKISGYNYLTIENVIAFLTQPVTIMMLLLLLIMMASIEVWHIGAIIYILDCSSQKYKTTVYSAMAYCVKNSRSIWKKGGLQMILYILFILPFMHLGTGLIGSIQIPEFITETIYTNRYLTLLLMMVYLFFLLCVLNWMFSMHYLILEKKGFRDSVSKSKKLIKGHMIPVVISIMFVYAVIMVLCSIFFLLEAGIIMILHPIDFYLSDILVSMSGLAFVILAILFTSMAIPLSYGLLSVVFYERQDYMNEKVIHVSLMEQKNGLLPKSKRTKIFAGTITLLLIITGAFFVRSVRHGDLNLDIEYVRSMEVSAHRGASAFYPENTMAAFKGAVLQNADWIELDVQQSSDGEIFVMHDTNFVRTTGVNKNCWEMSWEEISQLDAGSFFSEEYKGEHVPLLEEVIMMAKVTGIRLNIELKPTGHETDFEKKVVDIINKYHFTDDCVITSQMYGVLENVKKENSDIRTVYVMAIALGDIEQLKYADDFSIEASFVNAALVRRMHKLGKQVYAWTIDTEDHINKMIDIGVDNIISNDVPLAKKCVENSKNSNLIKEVFVNLFDK